MIFGGKPNVEKMENKKDVKGLTKALKHKDWSIRAAAAKALGNLGDAKTVERLIHAMWMTPWILQNSRLINDAERVMYFVEDIFERFMNPSRLLFKR